MFFLGPTGECSRWPTSPPTGRSVETGPPVKLPTSGRQVGLGESPSGPRSRWEVRGGASVGSGDANNFYASW